MAFLSLPINSAPKIKVWDKPYLVIVLYNGNQKWTAATNIADLIAIVSALANDLNFSIMDRCCFEDATLF